MPTGAYVRKLSGSFKNCLICNKLIYASKCRNNKKFCSIRCSNWLPKRTKEGILLSCDYCNKEVYRTKSGIVSKDVYCSRMCSSKSVGHKISIKLKGRKLSEEHKKKLSEAHKGEKSYLWRGGTPKCKVCSIKIGYKCTYCVKHKHLLWTKEHWQAQRIKTSKALMGKMPKNMQREGKFNNISRGWYDINGKRIFFRSKWEVNYALYLDWLVKNNEIKNWEYEKDTFIFEKIKFGTRSYLPDFKVFSNDGSIDYHEIKGWMDKKSATKLKRMRIYYPKIKLIVVGKNEYKDLTKKIGRIVGFI